MIFDDYVTPPMTTCVGKPAMNIGLCSKCMLRIHKKCTYAVRNTYNKLLLHVRHVVVIYVLRLLSRETIFQAIVINYAYVGNVM